MKKITKLLLMMLVLSLFMFGCGQEDKDTADTKEDLQQDVNENDSTEAENVTEDDEEPRFALIPNQMVLRMKDGSYQWDFRGLI